MTFSLNLAAQSGVYIYSIHHIPPVLWINSTIFQAVSHLYKGKTILEPDWPGADYICMQVGG